MLESNGSLTGLHTRYIAPAWIASDVTKAMITGLLALTISTLYLRPQILLLRFLRAVLLGTAFLCRHEILAIIGRATTRSAHTYAAIALSIQYAFAVAKASSGSKPSPTVKGQAPTLRPLVFPSHTTHTRFFPSRHSFGYSYLLVGIPIGWRHDAGLLSCDPAPTSGSRAWFSVHAEDYLARGGYQGGLRAKLDDFLRQQNVGPAVFPHVYLVTAPRFLGWSFNPVSFWYLYDERKVLKAMILEVNNTFDERRVYFLQPSTSDKGDKFRMRWQKDFHVSPFNDREGQYSLFAVDPFAIENSHSNPQAGAMVDNTITLSSPSPDARSKLVARVNSVAAPFDPSEFSLLQKARFTAKWCWTGFLTNPRILREARVLWTRRKLPVFFRPEVNAGSIGRQETSEEVVLEEGFREWLRSAATKKSLRVGYISAAGPARGRKLVLGSVGGRIQPEDADQPDFDVEILTPEWYAELARSADVKAVFTKRCFAAAAGEGMVVVSESGQRILVDMLSSGARPRRNSWTSANVVTVAVDRLRLGTSLIITSLYVMRSLVASVPRTDVKDKLSLSDLVDGLPGVGMLEMERAALTILLADRLAFGFVGLLRMYGKAVWYLLVYTAAALLSRILLT